MDYINTPLHHRLLTDTLPPIRPPLLTPREMHNRHRKERIRRLHNTRQHIIPRDKRSDHAENTARPRQSHVRVSVRCIRRIEVRCSKADECNPNHAEERAEGEGRFERAEPEEEGEDEPGEDLFFVVVSFVYTHVSCECWLLT
jgi:hypothetical protein